MVRPKRPLRAEGAQLKHSVALIALLLLVTGCGDSASEPTASDVPGDATAVPDPLPPTSVPIPPDQSLTTAEYVRLGLPAPSGEWSGDDMLQAAKTLTTVAAEGADRLPRYQSKKSGDVFARMNSPENLATFFSESVPIATRIQMAGNYVQGNSKILELYVAAFGKQLVGGSELVELTGTNLRSASAMYTLVQPFLASVKSDDPARAARLEDLGKKRLETAATVLSALQMLSERQRYNPAEFKRLVSFMRETFPSTIANCLPESRSEIISRLQEAQSNPALADLRAELNELEGDVQTAVARADSEARSQPVVQATPAPKKPTDQPAAASTGTTGPADDSLTTTQYLEKTLPVPDHPWSGEDMVQAARVLNSINKEDPRHLPRHRSDRSGEVFARLVAPDNIELFFSDDVQLDKRLGLAMAYLTAMGHIQKLYEKAFDSQFVGASELVELNAANFNYNLAYFDLGDSYLKATPKDDPHYQSGQAELQRLRKVIAGSAANGLKLLSDPKRLSSEDRTTLLGYMIESFPKMFPKMTELNRDELLKALDSAAVAPGLRGERRQLRRLNDDVKAALEEPEGTSKKAKTP
jgi:hypothetical protein